MSGTSFAVMVSIDPAEQRSLFPFNTIWNGASAPLATLGNDGDFYIQLVLSAGVTTVFLYGPKAAGAWPTPVALNQDAQTVGAGAGLVLVGGDLAANFGTTTGTVADGGALAALSAQIGSLPAAGIPAIAAALGYGILNYATPRTSISYYMGGL